MKLSILLPTHNRADVLPFAIEAVQAQWFADFELLVCGDGCTDSTEEIVARYAASDARIKWFSFPKAPGFGYANRNRVLREARGELIGFMAHDDLVTNDHFGLLVGAMEDSGAHLAYSGSVWVSREGEIVPTVFGLEDRKMLDEFLAQRWNRIPATCFMHRAGALDEIGGWNEELPRGGDLDFWGRILRVRGNGALRHVSTVTGLHFRANWRSHELAPDTEPAWQQLHRDVGRFAPAMRWPVSPGMTEQESFWRRMCAEPQIVDQMRDACGHALMTYAWNLELRLTAQFGPGGQEEKIRMLREKLTALKTRSAARDASFKRIRKERDRLKVELNAERKKRQWWRRLAFPFRFRQAKTPAAAPTSPVDFSSPSTNDGIKARLVQYAFYHIIPVTATISTPGNPAHLPSQRPVLAALEKLDLRNQRVLDVGCRDGLYSFAAEKHGASEIMGIDNDLSKGAVEFLIPFFRSKVRMREMNLLDLTPDTFGVFDVVIFAGVLYHLRHPFQALRILRELLRPGGILLIETAVFHGQGSRAMLYCPVGKDSPYDTTSCTFFNKKGLIDTLTSLGFRTLSWSCLHPEAETTHAFEEEPMIDRAVLVCENTGRSCNAEVERYWHGTHCVHADGGPSVKASGALSWREL